jgi:hypothetical protein
MEGWRKEWGLVEGWGVLQVRLLFRNHWWLLFKYAFPVAPSDATVALVPRGLRDPPEWWSLVTHYDSLNIALCPLCNLWAMQPSAHWHCTWVVIGPLIPDTLANFFLIYLVSIFKWSWAFGICKLNGCNIITAILTFPSTRLSTDWMSLVPEIAPSIYWSRMAHD